VIDLLVAGGGPAGLATAIHAARAGREAVVVERRLGPIDKACGEGLMPHTLRRLERLGVYTDGREFQGIRYLDGHRVAEARFRDGAGRGVRRTVLHQGLLDAATAAGVRIEHGEVVEVVQDSNSVSAAGFRARYLAAADRAAGGGVSGVMFTSNRGRTASRCTGHAMPRHM
jgi:flavin-dependent dehydrogenase